MSEKMSNILSGFGEIKGFSRGNGEEYLNCLLVLNRNNANNLLTLVWPERIRRNLHKKTKRLQYVEGKKIRKRGGGEKSYLEGREIQVLDFAEPLHHPVFQLIQ